MNNDIKNEIIAIAKNCSDRNSHNSDNIQSSSDEKLYTEAIDDLFSIAKEAIEIFNSYSKKEIISINKLPKEFLEMFLEIPGRRGGFCIISVTKLVIFFDEDPNTITVIGKYRNSDGSNKSISKVNQLLKVSFSRNDEIFEYRDNTGGSINPYEIVTILIRWVIS